MSHKRKHTTPTRTTTATRVDADTDLLPRKAFSVTGPPDYTDSAPQTAEEYLRRVKWEARNQPRIFTSTIDPRRFDHLQTKGYVRSIEPLPATSPRVMPSAEWESSFASQFADIRLSFAHYSQLHPPAEPQPRPPVTATAVADETITASRNCEAWARYCLGLSSRTSPPPKPSLPTVADFDQLTARGILSHTVTHLQQAVTRAQTQQKRNNTITRPEQEQPKSGEHKEAAGAGAAELDNAAMDSDEDDEDEDGDEPDEESVMLSAVSLHSPGSTSGMSSSRSDSLSILSASTTRWLYCLLAHLQKPLSGDTEVQLRQLYRVCGNIRAAAGKRLDTLHTQQPADRKQGEEEQQSREVRAVEETVMWCNMMLTIVDRIFGQRIPVQVIPAS